MEHSAVASSFKSRVLRKADLATSTDSIMFKQARVLDVVGDFGGLQTDVLSVSDLGLAVGRVASGGHEVWLAEQADFTFLLPLSGKLDLAVGSREYRANTEQFVVTGPAGRRTRAVADARGRFQAITLQVEASRLQRWSVASDTDLDTAILTDFAILTKSTARYLAAVVRRLADYVCGSGVQSVPLRVFAELGNLIDETLCELIDRSSDTNTARRVFPAYHKVHLAEEIMRDRCDESLSMLELAGSLGVNLRSLQLAFGEIYGRGPRQILTDLRLERARSRLLAADPQDSVTTVALDSGFLHLSRFAQAYARRFGERPSETLSRHRS
jgi:AraC-like DNA-binding protein